MNIYGVEHRSSPQNCITSGYLSVGYAHISYPKILHKGVHSRVIHYIVRGIEPAQASCQQYIIDLGKGREDDATKLCDNHSR